VVAVPPTMRTALVTTDARLASCIGTI